MNFGFTDEQERLRESVRRFLDDRCPLNEVRRIAADRAGFSTELWSQIAALGWTGITIAEAHGGLGLGWVDLLPVLEECGRSLFPSPLISTTLAAACLNETGTAAQQARWLPAIADGSCIATLALPPVGDDLDEASPAGVDGRPDKGGWSLSGIADFVLDAGSAALFVVAFKTDDGEPALALVERAAAGVKAENVRTLDTTKRMGRLVLDSTPLAAEALLARGDLARRAIANANDRGAVAVSVEAAGAADAVLRLTVDFARTRQQFGEPIGRFQGVKHPLAEMYVDLESLRSLAYYAAWTIDEKPEDLPRAASCAKAYVADAFARIGIDSIQLHGAIGYTAEYDAQLFLKRSKWVRPIFGDADHHHDRIATLGGI